MNKSKLALVLAILVWASAFVGIRAGLENFSPAGLALFRYLIASLLMSIIYYFLPQRNPINFRDKIGLLLVGVIGIGIYNIALNYGELTVSSGMASFIVSQSPIITTIFALLFLGERMTLKRTIGFVVSSLGVILICCGEEGGLHWTINILYVFLATLAGSCYLIMQKHFLKKYQAIEATTYIVWGGTLFLLFYQADLRQDMLHITWNDILIAVYLGIFPAVVGYIAWAYALREMATVHAVSYLYFTPFVAMFMGWLWLNEQPVLLSLLGGVLAMAGVWLVNRSYSYK